MARRVTLVVGSGTLAPLVAEAARRNGDTLQIIDVVGRTDIAADLVLHIPLLRAAEIPAAVLGFSTTHLLVAGAVRISDAERQALAKAHGNGWATRALGDIALAGTIVLYYRRHRIKLLGAEDVAPGLIAELGLIAGPAPSSEAIGWARAALLAAKTVGKLDLGQGVVVSGGRMLAAEDAGGTDALILRTAAFRDAGLAGDSEFPLILAKAMKPKQPRYADLPTIGAETVANAAVAGIRIIALEAGKSLVLDRAALIAEAQVRGVTVIGLKANG